MQGDSSYLSYLSSLYPDTNANANPNNASSTIKTGDSPEGVNILAYTGELEKLKAMVERSDKLKDGVTGFFPTPAISRAFDGIKENGNNITENSNNITDKENKNRADIILYLISKGADVSSITATSASPQVMSYIIQNIPDHVPDAVHEKIKNISLELGNSMSVAAPEVPVKTLKKYGTKIAQLAMNFTDESANKLLISIANDGTVGDLIDFYRVIVGKKKSINDFINYQQVDAKLTPLMVACINNNTEIVKKILSTENISSTINDTILRHTILSTKDADGNTFLHHAAYHYTLLDVIADYLQKISENDSHGIGTQKEFLSKEKNSSNDTAFSIVCKNNTTQFDLIKKLNDTGLIPEKDDISNPGFLELEKRFNELKTTMESTDYIMKYDPLTTSGHKAEIKEYLTLFKTIEYSLFNIRFADGTNFEQIYLQRWDNVLIKNDNKYNYKSDECIKNMFRSCDPKEDKYKIAFDLLLTKISQANKTLEGIYVVTYKIVCDAIQKKYGIFDTINGSQFRNADKYYFINNSNNKDNIMYEEEYDEIRKPLDDYILSIFEEELLRTVDQHNLKLKTSEYKFKSKYCKELGSMEKMLSSCKNQTVLSRDPNRKIYTDLIKKISEVNTKYKKNNKTDKYITYKSVLDNILEKYNISDKQELNEYKQEFFVLLMEKLKENSPKNVGYDKHPEAPSMFSGLWSKGGKSSNTHKRKHAQKQKNTRKHK